MEKWAMRCCGDGKMLKWNNGILEYWGNGVLSTEPLKI
jgi:hypothetical protein